MISRYFDSSIHILIDEMNTLMEGLSSRKRKEYANTRFCEADFAIKLGAPFSNLARYPMQGTQGRDIIVDSKHFEIEIKYWRNWIGATRKRVWEKSYQEAFDWLLKEIEKKNKDKRAIICCWFTFFEWRELLQLGRKRGGNPPVNASRLRILSFFAYKDGRIGTVRTNYSCKSGEIEEDGCVINWELYGNKTDKMNVLLLY